MEEDEQFRDEFIKAIKKESKDVFIKTACACGFQFTEEELKSVREELSDDQLDKVAGGIDKENFCDKYGWFDNVECSGGVWG